MIAEQGRSTCKERDVVLDEIRRLIITGIYKQGEKLTEINLCKKFSLNRNRVSEILQILTQEGFVSYTPFVGCSVSKMSPKDVIQIYDLLGTLEGLSMRIATPLLTDSDIDALENMVHGIYIDKTPEGIFRRNRHFHQRLTEYSQNSLLISFADLLRKHNLRISLTFFYNRNNIDTSLQRNMKIISALRTRDGIYAESVIRKHYTDARDVLIETMCCLKLE